MSVLPHRVCSAISGAGAQLTTTYTTAHRIACNILCIATPQRGGRYLLNTQKPMLFHSAPKMCASAIPESRPLMHYCLEDINTLV